MFYNYSRIFKALRDFPNELTYLKKAEETDSQSPKVKLAIALCYFYNSDYQEANEYFETLINNYSNNPKNTNKKFSFSVTKLYHLCQLYLGEYDTIIESSKDWKELEFWSGLVGVYRATALKRKLEFKFSSFSSNEVIIAEILDIFNFVLTSENYFDAACVEANKIIKDLNFIINPNYEYSNEIISQYLQFISVHFFNIVSKLRNENLTSTENQDFISNLYNFNIVDNPIHKVKWYKRTSEIDTVYDIEHVEELKEKGYEIVKVYHIPEDKGYGMSSFMFAKNDSDQEFYLSVNYFDQGWNRWGYIKEGDSLAIKFTKSSTINKPHPAIAIIEIDKF